MAVSAPSINVASPMAEGMYIALPASGTAHEINPGDYVAASGHYIIAVNTGIAYWKASGIGVAMVRNPAIDPAGRTIINSAVLVARYGQFRASANFSGQPLLGVLAGPVTTGSGVNAPSGVTGVGAKWNTAAPVAVSGGTAAAPVAGIAQVVGWRTGPGGTGQLDLVLWPRNADYY